MSTDFQKIIAFYTNFKKSLTSKIIFIGAIVLILQIPAFQIVSLIEERQSRKDATVKDICSKWGAAQSIVGPFIAIPYVERVTEGKDNREKLVRHWFTILPDNLVIDGSIQQECRTKGIYQAVLYSGKFKIDCSFSKAVFSEPRYSKIAKDMLLNEAIIGFSASDIKGLSECKVKIDSNQAKTIPGIPSCPLSGNGFHLQIPESVFASTPASAAQNTAGDKTVSVSMELTLNGSDNLNFYPLGRETVVRISSPWPSPNFMGAFLPASREISDKGFKAEWKISEINRNYPQSWVDSEYAIKDSSFGLGFYISSNVYQQSSRAAKYATLFIIFTMLSFLFAEKFSNTWMHPVQYFLTGLAIVLFYCMLLAFSEHTAFSTAYVISSMSVVLLVSFYCGLIFRLLKMALSVGVALLFAYGFLYFVLQLEDYSLIAGSISLFVFLALLMVLTKGMNRKESEVSPRER